MRTFPPASLFAWLVLAALPALGALPPVSPGERVVFSDDFADNRNQWSAVAVVNKTGAPATIQAAIANSEWTSSKQDSIAVTSTVVLKSPLRLKSGPVSVYLSVKVTDLNGTDGNRFGVALNEPAPNRGFVRLLTRPSANGFIEFRDSAGAGQSTPIESPRRVFDGVGTGVFKLTIKPAADGKSPAAAEAFYYNPKTKAYQSLGAVESQVSLPGGELNSVTLFFRNGENGPVLIDSVAVTQSAAAR